MCSTGGGPARVPNLRVCKHLGPRVVHAGREGRINVLPWYCLVGVVSGSSGDAQGWRTGLPARVSGRRVVRGWLSLPLLECAQVTGKADENGQHSVEMGGSSPWTRPSALGCGDTLQASASRVGAGEPGSGPLSTGPPASRTPLQF